jgi:hypothetical protein
MVRLGLLALVFVLILQVRGTAAADLIHKIPANDPARAHLRVLDRYGMLPSSRASLFDRNTERLMTRYDIAFALIEPLRLFIALTDPAETKDSSSEQRRLRQQAVQAVAPLSRDDMERLLISTSQLLHSFTVVIEELAPGLTDQAKSALLRIRRTMLQGAISANDDPRVIFRISVDPNAELDAMRNPLPLMLFTNNELEPKPFTGGSPDDPLVMRRPVNAMEAAIDMAYGRFQLFSKLSTLPGQDPSLLIIRPDQLSGSAMFRLQYNIGKIDDLSIAGIVEYHVLRSYDEPGGSSTRTGAVGGFSILW